jgi:hypothetical protein
MASTYEKIATTTASGSSTNVTFSSISGSYTDLVLIIANVTAQIDNVGVRLNSDTGTNYSRTILSGNGSSAAGNRGFNDTYLYTMYKDTAGGDPVMSIMQFQNYSNSTTYKNVLVRQETNSSGTKGAMGMVGLWRATPAAITNISITSLNANFNSGSTFTIYGILKAA